METCASYSMPDPGYEMPRMYLLGFSVNRGHARNWLRSRRRGAATPVLEWRKPDPPRWSALQTRSASKHPRALSARLTITLPDSDAIAKGDVLAVHLDKQAHRGRPLPAAGATSRLLFF